MEAYSKFDIKRINPLLSIATIIFFFTTFRITALYLQNELSVTISLMGMTERLFESINDVCHVTINGAATLVSCLPALTILNVGTTLLSAAAIFYLRRLLFHPFQQVRNLGDVGYITDGRNKKEVANEIRKRRRAGDVPPVYPNGWFSLLRSRELKTGEVKYVSALGKV